MKINIKKEKQNPLFDRKEITGTIESPTAPKNKDVAEELSKKYSVEKNSIKIIHIQGGFGSQKFKLKANVYKTNKERDEIENMSDKEKEAEKEEKKETENKEDESKEKPKENSDDKEEAEKEEKKPDTKKDEKKVFKSN